MRSNGYRSVARAVALRICMAAAVVEWTIRPLAPRAFTRLERCFRKTTCASQVNGHAHLRIYFIGSS